MVSSGLSGHPRTAGSRGRYLIALTLLFGLVGCSGRAAFVPDRSQDARIQQQVAARLAAEPALRANSIRVEVDGGTVMLHGAVRGIGEWQCALTNAELVSGVRSVSSSRAMRTAPIIPIDTASPCRSRNTQCTRSGP